jgi:predicted DNA-binding protein with PD1-like motif
MHAYEAGAEGRETLVVVMDQGDEAVAALTQAVREHGIMAAQVTAVGGFRTAELGFFDPDRLDFDRIPVNEQAEVLNLVGDVAETDGQATPHLHTVLGRRDGSTVGGHLMRAEVWPTLEVIVTQVPAELAKRTDPQTGLALIELPDPHARQVRD